MGLRETLNKNPLYAGVGVLLLCGVAIAVAVINSRDVTQMQASFAYYSSDDGKTFFADDINRIYPFDHGGRPAFRAYVYQCGDAEPYVSYLERYNDTVRSRIEQLAAEASPAAQGELADLKSDGVEVKKPGATEWTPLFSREGQLITMHPPCPDGSTARAVVP
jgi:hypothetical protein